VGTESTTVRSHQPFAMSIVALLVFFVPATAQDDRSEVAIPWTIGVSVGAGSQPDAISPICRAMETSSTIASAGLALGRLVGAIHLEGRLHGSFRGEIGCAEVGLTFEGVRTRSLQTAPGGGKVVASDLRVRLGASPASLFTAAAGVGWVWGKSTPYASLGGGTRVDDGWRWGVDLEIRGYFAPWQRQTADYVRGTVVEVISEEDFRRLALGFTISATFEVPRGR
jgi:hypothetical protein